MIDVRPFQTADWDVLLDLANEAVPFAPHDNEDWFAHRTAFDDSTRLRRHYIARRGDTRVAYGGVEQQGDDPRSLRVFVVASPSDMRGDVAEALYARLLEDARALGASEMWARELQADAPIQEFLTRHGFVEARRFTMPGLPPMVVFTLSVAPEAAPR